MSLLLDARKKSRQAQLAQGSDRASDTAEATDTDQQSAREAGRNLFAAKGSGFTLPNRGLLIALAATVVLLAAGLSYLWHLDTQSSDTLPPLDTRIALQSAGAPTDTPLPPPTETTLADAPEPVAGATAIDRPEPRQETRGPETAMRVERKRTETVDPLLEKAYLAYRDGKPDEARQLYQAMLGKGTRNTDALLGLAAIAQQRGENLLAAHYYSRVLTLDPRNAVANAGMSALNTDDEGDETRLKALLREQQNSTVLHFALGNLYAGQSRWSEAQQAYFDAYTQEPGNAEIAYNLAVSLDHLGQSRQAAQYYQRALQLDAAGSFDHTQVARRIERLGQPGR